mmetsp:Transcript_56478/g.157421  ORF Transcript_56478/g.157421 Transcript_56478/m.157421 type:complete len:297 (+) Transcript_56478:55-945(+)
MTAPIREMTHVEGQFSRPREWVTRAVDVETGLGDNEKQPWHHVGYVTRSIVLLGVILFAWQVSHGQERVIDAVVERRLSQPQQVSLRACLASAGVEASWPEDASWSNDTRIRNKAHTGAIHPTAYVLAKSVETVSAAVRCAAAHGEHVCPISGRHSYVAICRGGGVMVDVTPLNAVEPFANGTARIGSGACLGQVYSHLERVNRVVVGGTCPTVSTAGLWLGGGKGMFTRHYGLGSDNLLAVELVTPDGIARTVDATHHGSANNKRSSSASLMVIFFGWPAAAAAGRCQQSSRLST